jgi:hypothetical protein
MKPFFDIHQELLGYIRDESFNVFLTFANGQNGKPDPEASRFRMPLLFNSFNRHGFSHYGMLV